MSHVLKRASRTRGFTLIELLVVIAIIGILSSVVLASLNTARQKGADAAIRSDLTNARPQAELYYDDHSNSYDGVCSAGSGTINNQLAAAASNAGVSVALNAIGGNNVACNDTPTAWAAQAPLKATSNTFFCVDSSGQAVTVTGTVIKTTSDTSCNA